MKPMTADVDQTSRWRSGKISALLYVFVGGGDRGNNGAQHHDGHHAIRPTDACRLLKKSSPDFGHR
jgi:hypothetical protein